MSMCMSTAQARTKCWPRDRRFGIFPVNFCKKMPLVTCPCACRLCRLAQNDGPGIRVWHFPCKFPHRMLLVTCLCAFRLRRLAQNGGPGIYVRHFPLNFCTQCLLWHVHVHVDCAGSHKMLLPGYAFGIFPVNFHRMLLVTCPYACRLCRLAQNGGPGIRVRHFPCKFRHRMPLVTCPCISIAQARTRWWPRD